MYPRGWMTWASTVSRELKQPRAVPKAIRTIRNWRFLKTVFQPADRVVLTTVWE